MEIQTVGIDEVIPYAKNPRKNDAAVDKVAGSLKEFGWRQPIVVDAEMVVIAGHTRLAAARKLKLDQVPIHIATDLTANQIKAYRIADNRVSQEAKWDDDLLALELADLDLENYDLSKTGFNDDELAALMAEAITEGLVDEDQVPPEPETPVTVLGDIWQLGRHRVMCGDSTSIDAVDELMESQHPDMVFTDPPYNIDYQGVKDKRDKIKNDKMPDADFVDFLTASLLSCETMYVCCSWQYAHLFKDAMEKIARKPKAMIVWDKVNPAQNLDKYYKQHELIFYYGDFGGHKTLRGDVWKLKRQKNTMHPTMKPVELIEIALQDNVGKNLIYDAFGGSGSTLIACEKTNRQARLMELDPKYVDVIVKRWQDFTGLIAVNEKTGKTFNEMNNGSDHVSA
jgi:DNA modification methylase